MKLRPTRSTLFPYTTLFRSKTASDAVSAAINGAHRYSPSAGSSIGVQETPVEHPGRAGSGSDRKSTRLNSSHSQISYAVFCLKKKIEMNVNDINEVVLTLEK